MDKTLEQKEAWLDGYKSATETANSFKVSIDGGEIDKALNAGVNMVSSVLSRNVEKYIEEMDGL